MANTLIDLNNNKLTFDNKIITIINIQNDLWFKGNDVAKLLGYSDPKRAIQHHINKDKYKLTYENIIKKRGTESSPPLSYNEKNSIFINESGLYKLIFKSTLKIAEDFQEWIQDDVLPQIRKTGSYSIQSDRKLLETNFWNDNNILEYNDKNVIYIGYIGIHNNEQLFKFGISEQIYVREFEQHRKTFDIFKMVNIEICDNKRYVESAFKKQLSSLGLLRKQEFNSKNQTELFTITPQYELDKIINLLRECIEQNPLPIVKELKSELINVNTELNKLKAELEKIINENKDFKIKVEEIENNKRKHIEERQVNFSILVEKERKNINKYKEIKEIIKKKEESKNAEVQNEIIDKKQISKQNKCVDCGTDIRKKAKRCLDCYNKERLIIKDRPSYEQLIIDVKELNFTGTAAKYNVSDNAIRKWIKKYEIQKSEEEKILKKKNIQKPSYIELMNTIQSNKNNIKETSVKYEVDPSTIHEWRRNYEKNMSEEDKIIITNSKPTYEELMYTIKHTKSIREVAKKYDVYPTTIYKWKKKYEEETT